MDIKATEREIASWVSQEMNSILEKGGYPFETSTVEASAAGLFPDIVLWVSRETSKAFAFFELKRPFAKEDTAKLPQKARNLGAPYCVIWNFTEAYLFDFNKKPPETIRHYDKMLLMSKLEDWKRRDTQVKIKEAIKNFLDDLKQLREKKHLHDFIPDKLFFIELLRDSVRNLAPIFFKHFKTKVKDEKFREEIAGWAAKQGIANPGDELFYETLARQWAYGLITKIIFYLALRRHFDKLPDLNEEQLKAGYVGKTLVEAFAEAQKLDWQAVFEPDMLDKVGIPSETNEFLLDTLTKLRHYNFLLLKEDVIGEIFEELIPPEERHSLGQYFTKEDLVDFIIGFVAQDWTGPFLDPTCGSGTFLNRVYSAARWRSSYKMKHAQLLQNIWGVDIAKFPAELATINLFRQSVTDKTNFPRVAVKDFFEITPGMEFKFPPPTQGPEGFKKIRENMPQFAGIVGNFPYIRQELIEKKNKGYKKFLSKQLAKGWLLDFKELFQTASNLQNNNINKTKESFKEEWIESRVEDGKIKLKLSGQADIYAYLFFHAARFLKPEGRMGIVTSNSWLDVAYGYCLKKFFLEKFKIIAVVGSWVEPWFEDASVNTVFTVLERCDDAKEIKNHPAKFVILKKKLEELIPYRDLKLQGPDRWSRVDALVRRIICAGPDLPVRDKSAKYAQYGDIGSCDDDDFRIRIIKQEKLLEELQDEGERAKWGKYLRAPDVYFDIMDKAGDKFVPLKELADVKRGYTTGINHFFYLKPAGKAGKSGRLKVKNDRGWEGEIEEEFLKPIIKSPKESKTIVIDPHKLKYRLFVCNKSKKELKKTGKMGALKYIEWGETQTTKGGVPFTDVPSVKGRKYWHGIEEREPGRILMQMVNNDRFLVFHNEPSVLVDHNLFEWLVSDKDKLLIAFMNSTLFSLNREIISRMNLGDGATKTEGVDWKENVMAIRPETIKKSDVKNIVGAFDKIKRRPVKSIFEEVKKKDRRALDTAILEALGLDPGQYLPQIYDGLCSIVRERLELPKKRRARKKAVAARSVERIKEQVEAELLPGGVRRFPEAFVRSGDWRDAMEMPVAGKRLKIGGQFFGTYEIVDENGQKVCEADGMEKAKYILYAHKPDSYIIKMPKSGVIIARAVKEYELYIKDLKKRLVTRIFEATFDHRASERLAVEILEDHGVVA